jgi:hypothetical protein
MKVRQAGSMGLLGQFPSPSGDPSRVSVERQAQVRTFQALGPDVLALERHS